METEQFKRYTVIYSEYFQTGSHTNSITRFAHIESCNLSETINTDNRFGNNVWFIFEGWCTLENGDVDLAALDFREDNIELVTIEHIRENFILKATQRYNKVFNTGHHQYTITYNNHIVTVGQSTAGQPDGRITQYWADSILNTFIRNYKKHGI